MSGALVLLMLAGCAHNQSTPIRAFNAYRDAFAQGDAKTMWELTSAQARKSAGQYRARLLQTLSHPDPAQRIAVEGRLGVKAEDISKLDQPQFFSWAIAIIRHRLGKVFVRKQVESMTAVRLDRIDGGVAVIYRDDKGVESRMPMVRVDEKWCVDFTPLPKSVPPTKAQ